MATACFASEDDTVHEDRNTIFEDFYKLVQRIEWYRFSLLILLPAIGSIAAYFVPLQGKAAIFSLVYFSLGMLSITAGYHRLWAHKSYEANTGVKLVLAILGTSSGQGTIQAWAKNHRAHHRYSDSDKDPYGVNYGLLYAHIGWTVLKRDTRLVGRVDVDDLSKDPIVKWQARHYLLLYVSMGFVIPTLTMGLLFGDWLGGLIYVGILRVFLVQQATCCVNSLAHWVGDKPFSSKGSPRDNLAVALITMGEGFHNFHHQFPRDYRNGIQWYSYDPTKWLISLLHWIGLVQNLQQFSKNEIEKSRLQERQIVLDGEKKMVDWGIPIEKLPWMSLDEYKRDSRLGRRLLLIDSIIYDVNSFVEHHPGGAEIISSNIGTDASRAFNGAIYDHSTAARNLLASMRHARLTKPMLPRKQ
ncbi:unnamed protein product [Penicillium bialowiezense]